MPRKGFVGLEAQTLKFLRDEDKNKLEEQKNEQAEKTAKEKREKANARRRQLHNMKKEREQTEKETTQRETEPRVDEAATQKAEKRYAEHERLAKKYKFQCELAANQEVAARSALMAPCPPIQMNCTMIANVVGSAM